MLRANFTSRRAASAEVPAVKELKGSHVSLLISFPTYLDQNRFALRSAKSSARTFYLLHVFRIRHNLPIQLDQFVLQRHASLHLGRKKNSINAGEYRRFKWPHQIAAVQGTKHRKCKRGHWGKVFSARLSSCPAFFGPAKDRVGMSTVGDSRARSYHVGIAPAGTLSHATH